MLISFLVFLFGLFLVLGGYLLATHGSDAKRARLQKRLAEALLHSSHTEDAGHTRSQRTNERDSLGEPIFGQGPGCVAPKAVAGSS